MKRILALILMFTLLVLQSCAAKTGGAPSVSQLPEATAAASDPSGSSPSATAAALTVSGSPDSGEQTASETDGQTPSSTAAAAPTDKDMIHLEGTIGTYTVHMALIIQDGVVSGSYYYNNPEQDLKLDGTIEENRMLTMKEYDEAGQVTGTFDGWYVPGIRLEGSWTNAKTGDMLNFNLNVLSGIPEDAVWSGEWHRMNTGRFNSANLVVFNETETSFEFQIDAYSGSHMGFIEGTAKIGAESAQFIDSSTGTELMFVLQNGLVLVTANDAANGQAGAGVVFDGKYTNEELPEDTLLSLGYVPDMATDEAFRAMTGEDYELFLNTANIRDDGTDIDGLGASVYTWWVHGFGDYYGSIVMFLPSGGLCAGVLDRDNNVIKVYADDPAITAVPMTIQAWTDKYPGLMVQFYNTVKN